MIDTKLINDEFADIKNVIYLDISYVAMSPKSVKKTYLDFMHKCLQTHGKEVVGWSFDIVEEARYDVAQLINAESTEIAFTKNTAEGIGIIASGYPFESGDNIIIGNNEHASTLYAWINLQRKGVELKVISKWDKDITAEDFIKQIDEKTKAVVVSAVQFSSGYYVDLELLGQYCKDHNVLLVVDGIQAVGRLNIDVKKMNIDYMACGGYKGLLASFGVGFAYCSQKIIQQIQPPYASYQSVTDEGAEPTLTSDFSVLNWHKDARRLESGNLNYFGIPAVQAGVRLINKIGIEDIEKHVLSLEKTLRKELANLPLNVRLPEGDGYSGVVFVYYPLDAEKQVEEILAKYKIYATIRSGYIRMGINFYNTADQMAKVAMAFDEISQLVNTNVNI